MKTFHIFIYKTYLHEKLNTTKGIIRNRGLSSTTPEEIKTDLEKQEVTDYKRIIITRRGKEILTHIYILTFCKPIVPQKVKIRYCLKKLE